MSRGDPGPRNNRSRWTLNDLRYLEQNYSSRSLVELAKHLGRSPGAVALMADKLDCRRKKNRLWTEAEKNIIRQHYSSGVRAEFLRQLLPGRSVDAICNMAEKMGVLSGRFWQDDELDILRKYYPAEGTLIIARLPGRNAVSVRIMAKRLNLKKTSDSLSGFRPWSDDEWRRLEKNMHLSVAAQQSLLFPDRTLGAIEKARERLKKRQAGNL